MPYPLSPAPAIWRSPEELMHYAYQLLGELGLSDWEFTWDRALRRLGSCHVEKKRITLSRHFVAHYIQKGADSSMITEVLLHELAHALAWVQEAKRGHGPSWKAQCQKLGIPHERARKACDDFATPHARYAIIHQGTGEIVHQYVKKPRISAQRLRQYYIPGRKKESIGQLALVPLDSLEKTQSPALGDKALAP